MPTLCAPLKCTGCEACYNSCPHSAIEMQEMPPFGHLHPIINYDKCVECKLCEKSCPILHKNTFNISNNALAVWAMNNDIHDQSTSGGVASILTINFIRNNGNVYGCASISDRVEHILVSSVSEYKKLQGSKYVQSRILNIYQLILRDIRKNIPVLFFGTPCQVAGLKQFLKQFLKRDFSSLLITIDLICHGCPSQSLLKRHLYNIVNNGVKIRRISFRSHGEYCLKIEDENGVLYTNYPWKDRYSDAYFTAFINGYTFRESCYTCQFARPERIGDITIGDFWGLKHDTNISRQNKANGVSVVLCNTVNGRNFFNKYSDNFEIIERPIQEAIDGNAQLKCPKKKNWRIQLFRALYSKLNNLKASLYLTDWYLIPLYKIKEKIIQYSQR